MKKNRDFDFIESKLNNSGINAPFDINEGFVFDKIKDSNTEKKAEKIKFKGKAKLISSLVACLVVFAVAYVAVSSPFGNPAVKTTPITADASPIKAFSSYSELSKTIGDIQRKEKALDRMSGITYKAMSPKSVEILVEESAADGDSLLANDTDISLTGDFAETYKQVDAVDEADIIKTDGNYIYYVASGMYVKIFSATEKPQLISTIKTKSTDESVYDIFVKDNHLIVNIVSYGAETQATTVIYDISDAENPTEIKRFAQAGFYSSSRLIGDQLYVVSSDTAYNDEYVPYTICGGDRLKLDASRISCVDKPNSTSFLIISNIDVSDMKAETETKAILGASSNVYCNLDNMYITVSQYSMWKDVLGYDDETQIIKVSLNNGIEFTATATVDGYVNDQYSMDEYNGNLRIATTSKDKDGKDTNTLYILDEGLEKIGAINDFAKTESIKAVKYIGEYAYVITYEQIDPLFVMDLSTPTNPQILGSVEIEGFSSMLVPIDDNYLLGIGYSTSNDDGDEMEAADGIKLALFDISDKANPKVADEKEFQSAYSDVQHNPRALVRNTKRSNFTIPINYYNYSDVGIDSQNRCGEVTFNVSGGKINIDDEYISPSLTKQMLSVSRCTYVGDNIYLLTDDGSIDCTQYK